MGRIRTLKPEFFRSRSLAKCSIPARLTFEGLWCEGDDYGRGIADARILKGAVWPLDDAITHDEVAGHLDELENTGHIERYEHDGETYYAVLSWEGHQAARYRRGRGLYPGPDGNVPAQSPAQAPSSSDPDGRRNKEQGTGNVDQ